MQAQTIVKSTIVHTCDGNCLEVVNCIEELERIIENDNIKSSSFVTLDFSDGVKLHIKKESIIAFYKSE